VSLQKTSTPITENQKPITKPQCKASEEDFMFQFELGLINYIRELHKERDAKAAEKAEREEQESREKFMRNANETKAQAIGSRGGKGRD
jgi:hypothetical protein